MVAERSGTDPEATGKLLFALAAATICRPTATGATRHKISRNWLLPDSPKPRDKLLFQFD